MIIKIHNHCQFEPSNSPSFEGFCKWCGKEQSEHYKTMNNNKQSSIEWLVEQLSWYSEEMIFLYKNEIEQAKAMRKEEMMDFAFQVGRGQDYDDEEVRELAKIVYNETFGE